MSEETLSLPIEVDELTMLKQQAKTLGIEHSNNIGIDTLREKIKKVLESSLDSIPEVKENDSITKKIAKKSFRQAMFDEEMKLIRCKITNLNPQKKNSPGEIFTFANGFLGTVRKFIPYGDVTEVGYHIPNCIFKQLQERKYLQIRVLKVNGREEIKTDWVREFSLEIMPPLTSEEITQLANAQIASGRV